MSPGFRVMRGEDGDQACGQRDGLQRGPQRQQQDSARGQGQRPFLGIFAVKE